MGQNTTSYLIKFNRILVWITLILLVVIILSGYGITNPGFVSDLTGGVFTRAFSLSTHIRLVFVLLILLTLHVLIGAKTALVRRGVRDGLLLDSFLIVLGFFAVALLVLMQYYVL